MYKDTYKTHSHTELIIYLYVKLSAAWFGLFSCVLTHIHPRSGCPSKLTSEQLLE